ncbi:MAG: hypothetical protein ACLQVA_04090 [Candidatus Brocadiia bacterium]
MSRFGAVRKCFSELFEADLARLYAGETLVVRSVRREESQDGVTTPVWLLVAEGRGVVSTSRFLYRVVGAWAEAFAAPDYLLRPAYLDELQAIASRALDAPAVVTRERIFAPGSDFKAGPKTILQPLPGSPPSTVADLLARAARDGVLPLFLCAESDHASASGALAAGCSECGRMARLQVRR